MATRRVLAASTWFATGKLWYEAGRACPEHYPLEFCHGFAYAMGVTPELKQSEGFSEGCNCCCAESRWIANYKIVFGSGRTSSQAVARLCELILAITAANKAIPKIAVYENGNVDYKL